MADDRNAWLRNLSDEGEGLRGHINNAHFGLSTVEPPSDGEGRSQSLKRLFTRFRSRGPYLHYLVIS